MTVFALVDCNNFYVSCERAFAPKLQSTPVAVLSNNDGCVIARSNEVKELGVPMGAPYFQYKDLFQKHQVKIFSSNYTLYGDMSSRVMQILQEFCPDVEIYSIDEAFLCLKKIAHPEQFARDLQAAIRKWTGIPVSIGIGTTKTLAKVANKIAKSDPKTRGVFSLLDQGQIDVHLKKTAVQDIWGIGRRWAKKLHTSRIRTAFDLKNASLLNIQKMLSVVGQRIVLELNGKSCLSLELVQEPRKSLVVSRSFAQPLTDVVDIEEALCHHASRAAKKLRVDKLMAKHLSIFIHTNLHAKSAPIYYNQSQVSMPYYTDYTPEILDHARRLLKRIYKPPYRYMKVGICLSDFLPKNKEKQDLLDPVDREKEDRAMRALDTIHSRYGKNSLQFGRMLGKKRWVMQANRKSPNYTTNWDELLLIKAK